MAEPRLASRPLLEVADVIAGHGEAFLQKYGRQLRPIQKKALRDLARCRTAALGGHVERCLDCGHERIAYNSCRNRHCPKCQALSRARWLEREAAYLLPVEYHHVVFTLPAELAELAALNPQAIYNLLMQSAAQTLRDVAANPQRLGAQIGVLMVLHTWGQKPAPAPARALRGDRRRAVVQWARRGGCVAALGIVPAGLLPAGAGAEPGVRGKFLAGLRKLHAEGKLTMPPGCTKPTPWRVWLGPAARQGLGGVRQAAVWRTRAGAQVPGPLHAPRGHQQPAAGEAEAGRVTFRTRTMPDGRRQKRLTLSAEEFLRRFVSTFCPKLHEDPALWPAGQPAAASTAGASRLLLTAQQLEALLQGQQTQAVPTPITPAEPWRCPACGGQRRSRTELPRADGTPGKRRPEPSPAAPRDTS